MSELKNLDCLLVETQKLLLTLIDSAPFLEKYVLVGGSALALYLCHRKSEDLDFFTYSDSFNKDEIIDYLKKFDNKEIINQSDVQIDVLINGIKVTFFNAKWTFLKPEKAEACNLSSIKAIAAMKVNTLFLRAKYRDYYDLYFLAKEVFSIKDIFECSLVVVEGISFKLFAIALVYIDDIDDDNIKHLEPKVDISMKEIRAYFEDELRKYSKIIKY